MSYVHAPYPAHSTRKIVCFGEVIWDLLPGGPSLGGAPANVAVHLAALGHQVSLVSRVGDDERGHQALAQLTARGVDTAHVQLDASRPTGIIQTRLVDGTPRYERVPGCAWESIASSLRALRTAQQADALYFGTLAQHYPSGEALWQLLEHVPERCVRVCDLNLRPPCLDPEVLGRCLMNSDLVKMTDEEARTAGDLIGAKNLMTEVRTHFDVDMVAITHGARGATLRRAGELDQHVGIRAEPGGDEIGAGDAFTAVLLHGWFGDAPLPLINGAANRYASYVVSMRGAVPSVSQNGSRRDEGCMRAAKPTLVAEAASQDPTIRDLVRL